MANRWDLPLKIEHEVWKIIAKQERNGVAFDKDRAVQYIEDLKTYQAELYDRLRPYLSYVKDPEKRTVKIPYNKKTGQLSEKAKKLMGDNPYEVAGPFTHLEINLGSRDQLISQLLEQGWTPDKFTPTGNPKLTDGGKPVESLEQLGGLGGDIARWYILNHRKSVISGWLRNIRRDGRITAYANPCGANTTRMKHKVVVNVPKANTDKEGELIWDIDQQKDVFGTQMRSLFIASPGMVMVGYDASGLESRMLAHFLGDPELMDLILDPEKDFHSRIWNPIEEFVHSRDNAKNVEYALVK